jgi:hypothetical protein
MAQVMKYWNYPQTGVGFHSYKHSQYGTLSANFALTTYDWKSMPNDVTSSNKAVATLMYHCGVGIEMIYGVNGSGAYMISASSANKYCAEYALKVFFGYKSSLKGVSRSSYSDTQWVRMIKTELDAKRPILYDGFSNQPGQSGHCFIIDGYDNNSYFHLNWGWGGYNDGYYNINSLNPGMLNFDFSQAAIFGIEPKDVNSGSNPLEIIDSIKIQTVPLQVLQPPPPHLQGINFGTEEDKQTGKETPFSQSILRRYVSYDDNIFTFSITYSFIQWYLIVPMVIFMFMPMSDEKGTAKAGAKKNN